MIDTCVDDTLSPKKTAARWSKISALSVVKKERVLDLEHFSSISGCRRK
jgi:hypothetical protein